VSGVTAPGAPARISFLKAEEKRKKPKGDTAMGIVKRIIRAIGSIPVYAAGAVLAGIFLLQALLSAVSFSFGWTVLFLLAAAGWIKADLNDPTGVLRHLVR